MVLSAFIQRGAKMLNRLVIHILILHYRATAQLGKASITQIELKEQCITRCEKSNGDLFNELHQHTNDVLQQGARMPAETEDF